MRKKMEMKLEECSRVDATRTGRESAPWWRFFENATASTLTGCHRETCAHVDTPRTAVVREGGGTGREAPGVLWAPSIGHREQGECAQCTYTLLRNGSPLGITLTQGPPPASATIAPRRAETGTPLRFQGVSQAIDIGSLLPGRIAASRGLLVIQWARRLNGESWEIVLAPYGTSSPCAEYRDLEERQCFNVGRNARRL